VVPDEVKQNLLMQYQRHQRDVHQPPWFRVQGLVEVIDSGLVGSERGAARAEDAQGTPTQSQVSPSILVYEDKGRHIISDGGSLAARQDPVSSATTPGHRIGIANIDTDLISREVPGSTRQGELIDYKTSMITDEKTLRGLLFY